MRCFLILLAGAALATLALSPSLHRWLWYRIEPATPADHQPKYTIGGRIVTRDQWDEFYKQIGAVPA